MTTRMRLEDVRRIVREVIGEAQQKQATSSQKYLTLLKNAFMHTVRMEDLPWIRVLSATANIIVMEDIMDNDAGYYRLGGMHTSIKASDMPKGVTPKSISEFIMAHGGRSQPKCRGPVARRGPMGGYD